MGKCIIVSAGHFVPVEIISEKDDIVIACDAGLEHCLRVDVRPDYIIGDFDSLDPEYLDMVNEMRGSDPEKVITLPHEKDDTDTLAAIKDIRISDFTAHLAANVWSIQSLTCSASFTLRNMMQRDICLTMFR